MLNIILIIISLVVINSFYTKFTKPKRKTKTVKERKVEKEDHGDFVRIISNEKISSDLNDSYTFHVDVPKGNSYIINILEPIHGDHYTYDVKQRKWLDGISPFYYKAPSSFLNRIVETWEELNGPLPERKERVKITNVDAEIAILAPLKYDLAMLTDLPNEVPVKNQAGEIYSINLSKLSCSCADFIKRRSAFQDGDIRRVCKHIAQAIINNKLNAKITKNNLIRMFVKRSIGDKKGIPLFETIIHAKIKETVKGSGEFYILINKSDLPWLYVLILLKTTYHQNAYNFDEKRWANNINPFPYGSKAKYDFVFNDAIKKHIGYICTS